MEIMESIPAPASWGSVSKVYNEVERLTLPCAQKLVEMVHSLHSLEDPNVSAFDNGCGTGVLTLALKERFPNCSILAADASREMVNILKSRAKGAGQDVNTRVLDARDLEGIKNDTFTHTFSTFMVCLAPNPEQIAREMYRVTKKGGVLGLAVWGEPYFGYFNAPWAKACRMIMPEYEPVAIMDRNWTTLQHVKAGLENAGFADVDVREESQLWGWESAGELARYFLDGGNPGNEAMRETFKAQGGDVEKVRSLFEKIVEEDYRTSGGRVESAVLVCFATARK